MSATYHETWKAIAAAIGRSERWCRYTAMRAVDPLPIHKVGGIVRLNVADLEAWLAQQRTDLPRLAPETASGRCKICDDLLPLRVDGAVKEHKFRYSDGRVRTCVGTGRYPKERPSMTSAPPKTARGAPVPAKPRRNGDGPEPLCGTYLGDNDATTPQLWCIRPRGHSGLCDNVRGDAPPAPVEMPCPVCGTHPVPASCVRGECDPDNTGDVIRWDRSKS